MSLLKFHDVYVTYTCTRMMLDYNNMLCLVLQLPYVAPVNDLVGYLDKVSMCVYLYMHVYPVPMYFENPPAVVMQQNIALLCKLLPVLLMMFSCHNANVIHSPSPPLPHSPSNMFTLQFLHKTLLFFCGRGHIPLLPTHPLPRPPKNILDGILL